jgi:hypothetical protein
MKKSKRSAAKGLYREGNKLVIREGARFPGRWTTLWKKLGEKSGSTDSPGLH